MKLALRPARLDERGAVYLGLCCSDTTALHLGAPDYPESPVPSWDEFQRDFEDFYFEPDKRAQGAVLFIERDEGEEGGKGETIGCACYACFHLQPGLAELDIWLLRREWCGQGYGTAALRRLIETLAQGQGIREFILRPAARNARALAAYRKVGFVDEPATAQAATLARVLRPEFHTAYAAGDYGSANTAVLTLRLA